MDIKNFINPPDEAVVETGLITEIIAEFTPQEEEGKKMLLEIELVILHAQALEAFYSLQKYKEQ